uniref:Cytochrome c oxidase subunit 3 n=1 Tax=Nuttallia olivacea TaxID=1125678 RepID=I6NIM7_9BIVA|nr:cytochrome c oxidase subunit III [Nuttallia olivacea]AEV94301.1 cytochrome c oxidase subunit III [Nuttallia olivacea]
MCMYVYVYLYLVYVMVKVFMNEDLKSLSRSMATLSSPRIPRTGYHLVDPSPWPIMISAGVVNQAAGFISLVHGGAFTKVNFMCAGFLLGSSFYSWMMDIITEATYLGCHTSIVARGLKIGFVFFLCSEAFFFVGFFWAWFHSGLGCLAEGDSWPPYPIIPVSPHGAPFFNTMLLIVSGGLVNWAHRAIVLHAREAAMLPLGLCVLAGALFLRFQYLEYYAASFSIADSAYGSCFYMLTGLHGAHVLGGTLFLAAMWVRNYCCHFVKGHRCLGMTFATWYWHFVDVVWILVFAWAYVWPYMNFKDGKLLWFL